MILYVNKSKNMISNITFSKNYFIKYYINIYPFSNHLILNEIKINSILIKKKFKHNPKLIKVNKNYKITSLYFSKITKSKIESELSFFRQLLSIIKKLHSINIVHYDLKLSNILINSAQEIYIVDYAFSKIKNDINQIEDIKGLEKIAKILFQNKNIHFKSKNILSLIYEWRNKYEPIFKKRINKKNI